MKLTNQIIGAWRLVDWVFENETTGEKHSFYGANPDGLLIFDDSGWMTVQIAKEPRKDLNSDSFDTGLPEELSNAYKTYMGYFGKFRETEPGVLEHTVQNSLYPNWRGDIHIRYGEINGNNLVLSTPPTKTENGSISFKITWERQ